jgi:hypothetical protein
MVWIDIVEDDKKVGTAHLCTRGKKEPDICLFCLKLDGLRQLAGKLCDFDVSPPNQVTHRSPFAISQG